ncbi:MAG: hypothetical protein VX916_00435 [Planctomycetota bacterium]|nr:hypothetical protein [Planctomycetota bacterium]
MTFLGGGLAFLDPLVENVHQLLLLQGVSLAVLMAFAFRLLAGSRATQDKGVMTAVLLWAVALRAVVLVGTSPTLSDDIFRYVWEGRVVAVGENPYLSPPTDPGLEALASSAPEWEAINHPDLPAIYPPLSQAFFSLIASLRPDVLAFRIGAVAADLVLIFLLALLLKRRGGDPRLLVLYAWHPLAVLETASSGHIEPLAMIPMAVGLLLLFSPAVTSPGTSAFGFFGLAAATKWAGALPALFAVRQVRSLRGRLCACSALFFFFLVPWIFFLGEGVLPVGSLGVFLGNWINFAPLHGFIAQVVGGHPARVVCLVIWMAWITHLWRREKDLIQASALAFLGLLLCSPVIHPWYGLWVVFWLPLFPRLPVLLLTGLLPLQYLAWVSANGGGPWQAPFWALLTVYGLPLALFGLIQRQRASGPGLFGQISRG